MTFNPGDSVTFYHHKVLCVGEIQTFDARLGYRIHITGTLPPDLFGKADITLWKDEDRLDLEITPTKQIRYSQ